LHPILGCRKHGCNKQNKLWLQTFEISKMTLHAHQLIFNHPISNERITVNATLDEEFKRVGDILNFDLSSYS
jgi:tRNA pseudouridine65 synthase